MELTQTHRRLAFGVAAAGLLAGTALLDALTGRSLALAYFYLPPIAWAAWYTTRWTGWLATLGCAALWTWIDWSDLDRAVDAGFTWNAMVRVAWFVTILLLVQHLRHVVRRRDGLIVELQEAAARVRTLSGLLPICAWCNKIRDDEGSWQRVETYVERRTDAAFSHGICPTCLDAQREEDARARR
mgnify:CR=1 FL=1